MTDGGVDAGARRSRRRLGAVLGALWTVTVVGSLLAAVTGWVVFSGEREIGESNEALLQGDAYAATVHARRAAGWYAPGAPHVRVAYMRLIALATTAEGLGNAEIALLAWRGVRTAALETRWLKTPHEDDLARANAAIARLSANLPRPPGTRAEPNAVVEREHLAVLSKDEAPRAGWVLVLVLGFVGWVGGAIWALRQGSRAGGLGWKGTAPGIALCVAGIAAWLLAIWQA
ncbi:hypothetical protein [Chondromyces crocatus]|uniref:Uncharacterized protein n=1 Tax=Chondromyces crocatus TaxID=52 RepID=A0A0K1E5I8_CHOCO|nr:hypothetical protein [Chondromyces crocatus]AKT36099.1 uncharacterized protein CMC5_002120 [Chondromyces crocatus]